jgi:hypothetical protein
MGFYPQEGLTEMNKDGDVENRIGVEVMKLKVIIEKKAAKEIGSQEGQPTLDKMLKQNNFLRSPLDNLLRLQEAIMHECFEVSLKTLNCSPPIAGGGGGLGILTLRLGGTLLARHSFCHESLHSYALGGWRVGWWGSVPVDEGDLGSYS